ncbi:hypothetical protein ACR9MW_00910 [Helicobacter pylori]
MFILIRDLIFILIPVIIIGLILTAIRATIMAFKGDTDDEVESDGFLVEYGINSLNISALF